MRVQVNGYVRTRDAWEIFDHLFSKKPNMGAREKNYKYHAVQLPNNNNLRLVRNYLHSREQLLFPLRSSHIMLKMERKSALFIGIIRKLVGPGLTRITISSLHPSLFPDTGGSK